MAYDHLATRLKKALREKACMTMSADIRQAKHQLLLTIEQMESARQQKQMLGKLKTFYTAPLHQQQSAVKKVVMSAIVDTSPRTDWAGVLAQMFFRFSRKALAVGFSFVLLSTAFFGSFHALSPVILPLAQAVYLECSGTVFVNDQLCNLQGLHKVSPGDVISTKDLAEATIFYENAAVVRLNSTTKAALDELSPQQIHLTEGGLWLHSPGDLGRNTLKVSTAVVKAKIPQGSAGITTKGNVTQLVTSTAAVEVQIDSLQGSTRLVTVAPEKKLTVRGTTSRANIREGQLDRVSQEWVRNNRSKDREYLETVKKNTVEATLAEAGTLPGSVKDYVLKLTGTARTLLTWDQQDRLERQVSELNELFSEALVLSGKDDMTTAESTFEAYRAKFTSLAHEYSGKIRSEISDGNDDFLLGLLRNHLQAVAPFSPGDSQYVLKQDLERLVLDMPESAGTSPEAQRIVADSATKKILEAHEALNEGNVALSEEVLLEASLYLEQSAASYPLALTSSNIAVLDALAKKSAQLEPLVKEIKRKNIEQLRALMPQQQEVQVVANAVTGAAHEGSQQQPEEQETMMKVLGEAVKPEAL